MNFADERQVSHIDPLKIYYYVLLGSDDPHEVTPFQGFSRSWGPVLWSLERLAYLPCDILERSHDFPQVIAQRMGGMRPLAWTPLSIAALESLALDDVGVFVVLFTGEPDCANRASRWIKAQARSILHVSTVQIDGATDAEHFNVDVLHSYCVAAFMASPEAFSDEQRQAGEKALSGWTEPEPIPSGLKSDGHNILLPNQLTLRSAGRSLEPGEPFIGGSEQEYTHRILASSAAVMRIREEVGAYPVHFLTLFRPAIMLAEPALYRMSYKKFEGRGPLAEKTVKRVLRRIQTQKGLYSLDGNGMFADLQDSEDARTFLAVRQSELLTFTLGVALRAAQTASAVVRLSPGVNHVFPALAAYARNVRSDNVAARLKARRLFASIQDGLASAIGRDRIDFIQKEGGPIKIVSDAPIEWLPVGNLPLGLRYDCSRINATPGNLLMAQLADAHTLEVSPDALRKILIVSSFAEGDPLRHMLTASVKATSHQWIGKAEVIFKSVSSRAEFIDALNGFDGGILIFDGHGSDNAHEPIGKLIIGTEAVDVWEFRKKIRMPPIVILSACDTRGIDASSQATVGNGFLFLGARTVLATLLPVDGRAAAAFIARLILRVSDFIPAAIKARKRAVDWAEVISGMVRMLLASEVLDALVGPPADTDMPRGRMQRDANIDINMRQSERWFDGLLERIAQHRGEDLGHVAARAEGILARSQAIRYVQLGNPESIVIASDELYASVMKVYSRARSFADSPALRENEG